MGAGSVMSSSTSKLFARHRANRAGMTHGRIHPRQPDFHAAELPGVEQKYETQVPKPRRGTYDKTQQTDYRQRLGRPRQIDRPQSRDHQQVKQGGLEQYFVKMSLATSNSPT